MSHMAQPSIAASFLSDPDLKSQDLFSRVLVVSRLSAIGTRFNNNTLKRKQGNVGHSQQKQALEAFNQQITAILSRQVKTKSDYSNELKPRMITLNDEASELYLNYADKVERMMAQNEPFENIRGFASKLPEHAVRIAATVAMAEDIEIEIINYQHMESGTSIASFYASEAVRLFDEGTIDPKIILAEKLLSWLHNNWQEENAYRHFTCKNTLE